MPENILNLLQWVGVYATGVAALWIINAFAAGYNGGSATKEDFISSVLWPVSIASTIGMLVRLVVDTIKEK